MTDTVLDDTAGASHSGGVAGQGASPALPPGIGGLQPAEQPSTGSILATTTANNWAKQRAAIAAEVAEQYAATVTSQEDGQLENWLGGAARDLESADTVYQAKRQHFQQADYERTTARDARRADPKNAAKSTEWHASVQRAQQAQEALRGAREVLARAQALWDLLQQEAAQRGLQVAVSPPAKGASTSAAGSKRKRKGGAPQEPCPYCSHTYTVRDGLSSKLDAKGNRLHLRRCQCREKAPPCRNCPKCKAVVELMVMGQSEEQQRLCQATYACEICACKCPGAGKWVEADETSRKAFAARTEQRFGALSALGWSGGTGAGAASGAPSATTAAAGGSGSPAAAAAAGGATVGVPVVVAAALPATAAASGKGAATTAAAGRAASLGTGPSLRRLPADIRTELQAQQAQQGAVPQQEQSAHHHRCQHPHDECTSECCSAAHVPNPHVNPGNGHFQGQLCSGAVAVHDLPTLAALAAVNAQHAQQGSSMPFLASLVDGPFTSLSLPSSAVMLQQVVQQVVQQQQQLMQQLLASGGSLALPAAAAVAGSAAGQAGQAQGGQALQAAAVPPPPELPSEVLALLEQVFLHAAGQQAVDAVKAYLQEQRVTCLSDLDYLELQWLVKALQPAGLPEMLLNKFLQLGRRQAAAGSQQPRPLAAVLPQRLPLQQQQQQQQEPQEGAPEVQADTRNLASVVQPAEVRRM